MCTKHFIHTRSKKTKITLGSHFGKADLKSGRDVTPGHVSSFGVPMILHCKEKKKEQPYIKT